MDDIPVVTNKIIKMGRRSRFEYKCNADGLKELEDKQQIVCFNPQVEPQRQCFFCCVCNKGISRFTDCLNHCNSSKHLKEVASKFRKINSLSCKKCHSDSQISNLTTFCDSILFDKNILTDDDLAIRLGITKRVGKRLQKGGLKGIAVSLYGSSDTQLGFKDSDVNLNFNINKFEELDSKLGVTDKTSLFWQSYEILKESNQFSDFQEHFARKYPEFLFKDNESGLRCLVKLHVEPLLESNRLVKHYILADKRFRQLYILLKLWCKKIGVSDREAGGIPSYNLMIMMLYYLQHTSPPVVPIIKTGNTEGLNERVLMDPAKEKVNTVDPDKVSLWKSENIDSLGKLWLGFLRFYTADFIRKSLVINIRQFTPLTRSHKEFASRRFAIEDPFNLKENISKFASNAVVGYYLESMEISYRYFTSYCQHKVPRLKDEDLFRDWTKAPQEFAEGLDDKTADKTADKPKENQKDTSVEESNNNEITFERGQETEESDSDDIIIETTSESDEKVSKSEEEDFVKVSHSSNENSASAQESFVDVALETPKKSLLMNESEMVLAIDDAINQIVEPSTRDNDVKQDTGDVIDTGSEVDDIVKGVGELDMVKMSATPDDNDVKKDGDVNPGDVISTGSDVDDIVKGVGELDMVKMSATPDDNEDVESSLPEKVNALKEVTRGKENDSADSEISENEKLNGMKKEEEREFSDNKVARDTGNNSGDPDREIGKEADRSAEEGGRTGPLDGENSIIGSFKDKGVGGSDTVKETDGKHIEQKASGDDCDDIGVEKEVLLKDTKQEEGRRLTGATENELNEKDDPITYKFNTENLRPKQKPPVYCRECNQDGHVSKKCPLANFRVNALPPMQKDFAVRMNSACESVMQEMALQPAEFDLRIKVLEKLEACLRLHYKKSCRLVLFGSSVNGFGFSGSDMDICLQFANTPEAPHDVDPVDVVKRVQKTLENEPQYRKVYAIKTAKVPIVKFCVDVGGKAHAPATTLEGDISFYNVLAIQNSTMLSTYAMIDHRVRALGYCLKVFAKRCEIGDASRGSLSSYAYVLLLLFYLQRCSPPVVPVLQELYDNKGKKPEHMVEGCDTWFYKDVKKLPSKWSGYNKNKQSVGELFVGFFRFYLEEFDFLRQVVAMKQSTPLYKYEKSWNSAVVAIEDPFLLRHNLGAGLHRNMFHFIRQCFLAARSHFGDSTRTLPDTKSVKVLQDNFFNRKLLVGNERLPQDRLCRRCGKIGHFAASCAEKMAIDRDRKRGDSESDSRHDSEDGRGDLTKDKSRFMFCHNCRQKGHTRVDCPQKRRGRGGEGGGETRDLSEVTCFYCKEKGHVKHACPARKADKEAEFHLERENIQKHGREREDAQKHGREREDTQKHGREREDAPKHGRLIQRDNNGDRTVIGQQQNTPFKQRSETTASPHPVSPISRPVAKANQPLHQNIMSPPVVLLTNEQINSIFHRQQQHVHCHQNLPQSPGNFDFNQFASRLQEAQKHASHGSPNPHQQYAQGGTHQIRHHGQKMTPHNTHFQHQGSPHRDTRRTLYDDEYPTIEDEEISGPQQQSRQRNNSGGGHPESRHRGGGKNRSAYQEYQQRNHQDQSNNRR